MEVAIKPEGVAVRNSTDPNKNTVYFSAEEWGAFVQGVKGGEFNITWPTSKKRTTHTGDRNIPCNYLLIIFMNTIFYPGLGETKKDYQSLAHHMNIADIDWNTGKATSARGCDTVVSFSLGNVFSLDIALKKKLKKLILCSPTPFESLGKHKAQEVIIIVGEKEKFLQKIYQPLCTKQQVKMIIVPKAGHKINATYENIILQNL